MTEVLFVSKPVAPPWNDSSKNLVRDITGHLRRHRPLLIERSGAEGKSFSPGLRENVGVFRHLLWDANADIWHFFFAPNRKSSGAARFAAAVRRVPTVHTVCSLPKEGAALDKLVFADVTVVLSRLAHDRFRASGVSDACLRLIPPSVPPLCEPGADDRSALRRKHMLPESAEIWIYPGDLEHGGGAQVTLEGFAAYGRRDTLLLMACRDKTRASGPARAALVDHAKRWGIDGRLRWLGETPDIHELLALSDFTVLPNRSPYAKMDYPLVALEAMCMGCAVLVGRETPAEELAEGGAAIAVEPTGDALAAAVETLSADCQRREALGRAARALVLERFSPTKVTEKYEWLYEALHAR